MSEEVIQPETVTRDLENNFSWARQSLFLVFINVSLGVSVTLIKLYGHIKKTLKIIKYKKYTITKLYFDKESRNIYKYKNLLNI